MNKLIRVFSLLVAVFGLSVATAALANDNWDWVGVTPTDGWDNYAIEGQSCATDAYGHSRQCAPGLACEYAYGQGICKRLCHSQYDCSYGESCDFNGYVGVCRHYNDGIGTSPSYPNYPDVAGEGQTCSDHGRGYARCARGLACRDYDRNGVGVCYAQCRTHQECGYGNYCAQGACAPDRNNRGGRRY